MATARLARLTQRTLAGKFWIGILLALPVTLLASLALTGCGNEGARREPTVTANGERLVGASGQRHARIAIFRGIPYAAPPVGQLRWRAPEPHAPRAGEQRATAFAAACYQDGYNNDWYRKVAAAFGAPDEQFRDPPFSEDCLYLNVWTPALDRRAALPVFVWIHGGSNKAGWTAEPNYDGEELAARGHVVVVSIAYRLGVFGFIGHPQLTGSAAPANFGLLDQIAALRWVRDEIRTFGGDPSDVTIAGESAGAAAVGYLASSPLATGLFRRLISQSGGFQMAEDLKLADAERVGLAVGAALPGNPDLAAMRERSSAEVFAAAKQALPGYYYSAVVDGVSLELPPAEFYRRHGLPFDLLIGSNENEWYMNVDDDPQSLAKALEPIAPEARELLAARAAQEPSVRHGHDRVVSLSAFDCPAYAMAAAAAAGGRRAWVYRFTRVRPGPGGAALLAYHAAEIPYVFDSHDAWLSREDADNRLTDAMVGYWSNFTRVGDPNGTGLEPWPAFDDADARLQELGAQIRPLPAADKGLCDRLAPRLYPGWSAPQPSRHADPPQRNGGE
jgi:para-nitrobenzyl esterase